MDSEYHGLRAGSLSLANGISGSSNRLYDGDGRIGQGEYMLAAIETPS